MASVTGLLLFGDDLVPAEIKAKLHVLTFGQPLVMLDGAGPDAIDQLDCANAAALGGSAAAGRAGAPGCVASRFQAVVNGMDIIPRLLGHRLNPSEAEVLRWISNEGAEYLKSFKQEIGWIKDAEDRVQDYRPVGVYLHVREKGNASAGNRSHALTPTEVVRIKPDWVMPFLRMHLAKDTDLFAALYTLKLNLAAMYNRTGASPESIAEATIVLKTSPGIADHTSYAEKVISASSVAWEWQTPGWKSIPFDAKVFP